MIGPFPGEPVTLRHSDDWGPPTFNDRGVPVFPWVRTNADGSLSRYGFAEGFEPFRPPAGSWAIVVARRPGTWHHPSFPTTEGCELVLICVAGRVGWTYLDQLVRHP